MTEARPSGDISDIAASGNFLVADGARLEGNFRCDGHARVGRNAVVEGSLDVAGSLAIRENAAVTGSVACGGEADWHPTATAAAVRCGGAFRIGTHQLAAALEARDGIAIWDAKEGSA